ncbi:unnamed protein product [Rotaria sp. Silwood2]|nr:unnamed protein product [Rotaria sp. Silwood2]CAF4576602.1 unnamed protein product [Rotaria sp. Silwood2]
MSKHDMTDFSGDNDDENNIIDKKEEHSFKNTVFVHDFNQCTQDSETIVAIWSDVLCHVRETDPQIKSAFLRSDNAGCYPSVNTFVAAKQVSEKISVTKRRIDFCDPQDGKGSCDRYAAVIKLNTRRYLNENHNVASASEFVEACHSHKGVKDVLARICHIKNSTRAK